MKRLILLLLIAIYFPLPKVSASTLTQLAAGATIGISVLEAPETWKKFKRAVRKVQHPKKKEQQSTPPVIFVPFTPQWSAPQQTTQPLVERTPVS